MEQCPAKCRRPQRTRRSPRWPPSVFGTVPRNAAAHQPIVAGSEQVFGPDQSPGPHYGYRTQYTRVSASGDAPGLNQYKINYTDVPNAALAITNDRTIRESAMGYIEFDSAERHDRFGLTRSELRQRWHGERTVPPALAGVGAAGLSPAQPAADQKRGRRRNVPSDPVEVTYRFQMNRPNDVVKADYLTRDLMNISMNVRYYDPRSSRPQEMNLTGQVKTRNLQR